MATLRTTAALLAALGLAACAAERLDSAVGRHVVLHWDPDEYRVCGGTLEYVDRSLEVVAQTYDLALPERPTVDMILSEDLGLALALCRVEAGGCTSTYPNGTALMVLNRPVHAHELTHALRLTGSRQTMPRLFREGLAVRWEHGPTELDGAKPEYRAALDYGSLRAQLERQDLATADYLDAGFLWAWLEAEHGPEAMAGFAAQLTRFAAADEIERAFERSFGLSLAAAVEASRGQPLPMFDVHACAMPQLPTLRWTGAPLELSTAAGACADAGVVDIRSRAARFIRLELPGPAREYSLTVTGASDTELRFDACLGVARPYAAAPRVEPGPARTIALAGSYVVGSFAPIAADGRIQFPHAELAEAPESP